MKSVLFLCFLLLSSCFGPKDTTKTPLRDWYKSQEIRGDQRTVGDYKLNIRPVKNRIPVGVVAIICAGAGCPIKFPYAFIDVPSIRAEMNKVCLGETPQCELSRLAKAVVLMEMEVFEKSLKPMSMQVQRAYHIKETDFIKVAKGKQLDHDCVDSASNGSSYLRVLRNHGLLKHFDVIYPGYETRSGMPHYYTRLREISSGDLYKFDLFHRGEFGLDPVVEKIVPEKKPESEPEKPDEKSS